MHPTIATTIVNDRISTLMRQAAKERLAAATAGRQERHRPVTSGTRTGLRAWLRLVVRGA